MSLATPHEEMTDSNCDASNDGATHSNDDPPEDPQFTSSFLDKLRRDDASAISYSYYSTVSTNYTMSNLPGTGRNLGNFYSWAGAALERRLGQLAERADAKKREEAVSALQSKRGLYRMFWGDDPREHGKACKMLLICANRSDNIGVQIDAFREIVWGVIKCPTKVRSALMRVLERQKEVGETVASSWKRPGVVDYTLEWLYWHDMASRCLSTSSDHKALFDATAQFDGAKFQSLDFSRFEELLLSSSDTTDLIIALRFITSYWDGDGPLFFLFTSYFDPPNHFHHFGKSCRRLRENERLW
ncbi:hypothetical protein SCHPADRAFT_514982 [Schizopora paradoxa]|uniref:Uncharacterized protein n=1 Tax=Schizopora paradoxa TaxID=27342 RepID=A0A0H2RG27_9AGAM|nr:hypothetical protein SCHPADRAFT_514982 [Schizopora paradoxa]